MNSTSFFFYFKSNVVALHSLGRNMGTHFDEIHALSCYRMGIHKLMMAFYSCQKRSLGAEVEVRLGRFGLVGGGPDGKRIVGYPASHSVDEYILFQSTLVQGLPLPSLAL